MWTVDKIAILATLCSTINDNCTVVVIFMWCLNVFILLYYAIFTLMYLVSVSAMFHRSDVSGCVIFTFCAVRKTCIICCNGVYLAHKITAFCGFTTRANLLLHRGEVMWSLMFVYQSFCERDGITHKRIDGCQPNVVGMDKGWPSRSG